MTGPLNAAFYLTARCNQSCYYCVSRIHRSSRPKDMTAEQVEHILQLFPTLQAVGLGGGESLLCPGIWDIVRVLKKRRKGIIISTNGTLIHKHPNAPWKGLRVNVSARAGQKEDYERVSGVATFEAMQEGVRVALDRGAQVRLSFVVDKSNLHGIYGCAKMAHSLGVKVVSFMSVLPNGEKQLLLREADMPPVNAQKDKVLALGLRLIQWPTPIYSNQGRGCKMAREHLAVDGDGSVALCCRGSGPRPEMGNISSGASVWSSGPMQELRRRVYDLNNQPEKCLQCKANW
jgi:radical SAM protein with 4Fe4S-binding SPASM domain